MTPEQEDVLYKIISECGLFLENPPVIADAELLPYPKDVLWAALDWKERNLSKQLKEQLRMQIPVSEADDRLFYALSDVKFSVGLYAEIDPEDRERVDYFNTFKRWGDVTPEEDFLECSSLRVKYSKKGSDDLQRER